MVKKLLVIAALALVATSALGGTTASPPSTPTAPSGDPVVIAAIQIGAPDEQLTEACDDDDHTCMAEQLVERAATQGADVVILPEYALDQHEDEPDPEVGGSPGDDQPVLSRFAAAAEAAGIYLFVHLTTEGAPGGELFSTLVALGPDGTVVAKHHKIELYGPERATLTPGTAPTAVDTPFGRVGMLICADLYADPSVHRALAALDVDIVVVANQWTVAGATRWQAAFARDWNVHLAAANDATGPGRGGGVFGPDGRALAVHQEPTSAVVVATISRAP